MKTTTTVGALLHEHLLVAAVQENDQDAFARILPQVSSNQVCLRVAQVAINHDRPRFLLLLLPSIDRPQQVNDLLCKATGLGSVQCVDQLLSGGWFEHQVLIRAMERAAAKGHLPCLQRLLQDTCAASGFDPVIDEAISSGHVACADLLVKASPDQHKACRWALFTACAEGRRDMVDHFLLDAPPGTAGWVAEQLCRKGYPDECNLLADYLSLEECRRILDLAASQSTPSARDLSVIQSRLAQQELRAQTPPSPDRAKPRI